MQNEYVVNRTGPHTAAFDWRELENRNKDMQGKILSFAGAKLSRTRENQRRLQDELLPRVLPEFLFQRPRLVDIIETLVLERPRHHILSHCRCEKMTVTFSSYVDRNWWGFATWEEAGKPLDRDAICNAMDFKQTVTDVIKIRLVPGRLESLAADVWHVEVVRKVQDDEQTVKIGYDGESKIIDYFVYMLAEHQGFERRLKSTLKLRHKINENDGADEFSV